jgi:hypothetical protein
MTAQKAPAIKHMITIDASFILLLPIRELLCFAPKRESDRQIQQIQESRSNHGVSLPDKRLSMVFSYSDLCLSFKPLDAKTPPNDPVRKIANVLSRSMKAASLGACAPIG